jgi:protein subunit release factor A
MKTYTYKEVEVQIIADSWKNQGYGGQSVGLTPSGMTLHVEGVVSVYINNYRSQIKNFDFAKQLVELAIDEFIK